MSTFYKGPWLDFQGKWLMMTMDCIRRLLAFAFVSLQPDDASRLEALLSRGSDGKMKMMTFLQTDCVLR